MKRKLLSRGISIALVAVMLLTAAFTSVTAINAVPAAGTATIPFENPAIPANAGERVDLSAYAVELKDGTVSAANKITWSSSQLTISGNKVTPSAKGVYKLSATDGASTKTIYLVVKNASESEYVLYYNDFSNSATISDFTKESSSHTGTTYRIENGKFILDTTSNDTHGGRVLLPSWLGDFGNYKISSNATITSANNNSRWMSVMYRFQTTSTNPHWYQMAVRQNATAENGVEIAYRKPDAAWNVINKQAHSTALASGTYYKFELNVSGKAISQTLGGAAAGSLSNSLTAAATGQIALGGAGCVASFDDIKVCIELESLTPSSNITLTPTMAYEVKDSAALNGIMTNTPDVAIMSLNSSGNIVASNGSTIASISDAVAKLQGKVIPAFRLATGCSVSNATTHINSLGTDDVMVISNVSTTISSIRSTNSRIIGVLDLSKNDLSNKKLWEIRAMVLKCGARICILPQEMATQRNVADLNTMGVTVWFAANDNTDVEAFKLVTSGANGIITLDRALMTNTLNSPVFKENSIIRPVGVIGHRGTPALAPELTIAGSAYAATNGANIIENDLFITKDGVVVVSHDNSVATITNGSGNVEDYDLAWYKQFMVVDQPNLSNAPLPTITANQPVATLEDYFMCFKDTDTFMFLEIKSKQSDTIVKAMKALIDEYDIADQCGVIAFDDPNIKAVRTYMPELSVGKLTGALGNVDNVANTVTALESSYNPDGKSTFIDNTIVRDLANRGIFTWPWTINDSNMFDQYMLNGVGGITTDHSYYAQEYIRLLYTDKTECNVTPGKTTNLSVLAEYYGAEADDDTFANIVATCNNAEMILLSGNETVKFSQGKLTATEYGDATVLFRTSYSLNDGTTVHVYTQPVTINIEDPNAKNENENNNENNENNNNEPQSSNPVASDTQSTEPQTTDEAPKKKGCGSAIGATATVVAIAAATIGFTAIVKRKEEN